MLIAGAGGFAKEVYEVLMQQGYKCSRWIVFFDDHNQDNPDKLYGYRILKSSDHAKEFLGGIYNDFVLGVGTPAIRMALAQKMQKLGGNLASVISPRAHIGTHSEIGRGVSIMTGAIITNDCHIAGGCLINLNATVGHDTTLEPYVELCPGVGIGGHCYIGAYTFIGTNATVLPGIRIGRHCTIGAGAVVTKDVPDGATVVGVPGKIIKQSLVPA
jgi:sugar O-acyltransferase (sialic acid O-acetyltransferase NeuD family)